MTALPPKTHGCLVRNALAWDEYWRWDVDDEVVAMYYDAADEPQGYLVYLLKREIFKIKEMVYLNDEARRGMWDYVTAHYSMVTEVSGCNYTNHSLALANVNVPEPRMIQIQPWEASMVKEIEKA